MDKKIHIDLSDPDFWKDVDWSEPVQPEILKKVTDATQNYRRASQAKANDPEYRKKLKAKQEELKNSPEMQKVYKKRGEKIAQSEGWKKNQLIGAKKRKEDGSYQRMGEQNRERAKDPKWLEANKKAINKKISDPNWRQRALELGKFKFKPVVTPKGIFESLKNAKENLKIDMPYVLKKHPDQYFYITQEGFERLKLITDPEEFQKQLLIEKQHYIDTKKK